MSVLNKLHWGQMKKTGKALLVLAIGLASGNALAQSKGMTCGDAISSDAAKRSRMIADAKMAGFKFATYTLAEQNYDDLEKKGVVNRLSSTLDFFEETLLPTKELAEEVWVQSVELKSDEKGAIQFYCKDPDKQLVALFRDLYFHVFAKRFEKNN
jgi:hypothetical protein